MPTLETRHNISLGPPLPGGLMRAQHATACTRHLCLVGVVIAIIYLLFNLRTRNL